MKLLKRESPVNFKDHRVRVVDIDGSPWFVAADVIFALSYSRVDAALRVLNETERMVFRPSTTHQTWGGDDYRLIFGTPARHVSLISEPGLYKLVLRSRKPDAQDFKNWVTRDVLPAIRKDGMYVKGDCWTESRR